MNGAEVSLYIWVILAFIIGVILISIVRRFATFIGAVDAPRERHNHKRTTPTLGGLANFY